MLSSIAEVRARCGGVKSSETDNVFLTQQRRDHLDSLFKQGVTIAGDHILEILPFIIGFYEVRPFSLVKSIDGDLAPGA